MGDSLATMIEIRDPDHLGQKVLGLNPPARTFASGRVCAREGCTTRLSIYNPYARCSAHEPIHFPRITGRRRGRAA